MGLFTVGCKVENHADSKKSAVIPRMMVDTGSEFTWIDEKILKRIGVDPVKKDLQIQMANGQIITRSVGFAILRVDQCFTIDEVVFAQKGDLLLLGSRALEGLGLRVDARRKRLVAAGPAIAATAIRPYMAAGIVVGERRKPSLQRAGKRTQRHPANFIKQRLKLTHGKTDRLY
jgi:predicted aspartyl protease